MRAVHVADSRAAKRAQECCAAPRVELPGVLAQPSRNIVQIRWLHALIYAAAFVIVFYDAQLQYCVRIVLFIVMSIVEPLWLQCALCNCSGYNVN
jgi:hypothetical protein